MKILDREINAVIFDLDGTLLNSSDIWVRVDRVFFREHGMDIPYKYHEKIAHTGLTDAAIFTKKEYGLKESVEEILNRWRDLSIQEYENNVKLKDNASEYLKYLKKHNIKIALATANSKEYYLPCLKRLKILNYFDIIQDVDDVNYGKDDVTLYNTVAEKLQEKPENIAVFEDISICLQTAFENGYLAIAVYDKNSEYEDKLKRQYSYKFIYNFNEMMHEKY